MILEAQFSDAARSDSLVVGAPIDHRAARTDHPDAVALDGRIKFAAALVFQVEGVEVGEESATLSAHAARLCGRRRYVNAADRTTRER